jgi:membrane-associated phospholipid phosphatase
MRPRLLLALVLAAAFAGLAVAVAQSDTVYRADEWAVQHVMPGLEPYGRPPPPEQAIVPLRHLGTGGRRAVRSVADVWTLPASAGVSFLLFALGGFLLWRRGQRVAALVWVGAWLVGNGIELLCKHTLDRPPLYGYDTGRRIHVQGFDSSYPSGHTLRAVLLAALVAALRPRLRWRAVAWAAIALVALLLAGFHAPTDIVGGILLAALLIVLVPVVTRDTSRP